MAASTPKIAGEWVRREAPYRDWIKKGSTEHPPEVGRYVMYISHACPWATRCHAVLKMKGLEHAVKVYVTHQTWQRTRPDKDEHAGWVFRAPGDPPLTNPLGHGSFPCDWCVPDEENGCQDVRAIYELDNGGPFEGTHPTFSVPVIWDTQKKRIVSNESSEILRMFNSEFNDTAKNPDLDLYPEALRAEIDEVNEWVYTDINNGVYRCGFAKSQEAYEAAVAALFRSLDRCEEILSRQRYIAGDVLTEADIRLFMTLVRFDDVYVVYFKTNCKAIREYTNLSNYVKELHQVPGVGDVIELDYIKQHYFSSHPSLNTYAIVPVGRGSAWFSEPHDRDEKFPARG